MILQYKLMQKKGVLLDRQSLLDMSMCSEHEVYSICLGELFPLIQTMLHLVA